MTIQTIQHAFVWFNVLLFHLLYANGNLLSIHGLTYCSIIRAFLVEEQKIVKKVLKIQKSKEKLAAKAQA
jgi:hypothetical protein